MDEEGYFYRNQDLWRSLDAKAARREIRTLIKEMAPRKAIIISTHILEEVDAVCTRAIIIGRGRVLVAGTPAELEARSRYYNAVALVLNHGAAGNAKQRWWTLSNVEDIEELPMRDGFNGWEVDELRVETGHLDQVFRTITADFNEGARA